MNDNNQPRSKSGVETTDWIGHWQRVARRVRVPLGFLTGGLYLFELWQRQPEPRAVAWSLALVGPGVWLRAYASGYVKKNQELTQTGPYGWTRNPLYLGSMLMAAGFAVALGSWLVAGALAGMFALIYVPVIAGEERFLRGAFPEFEEYCRRVPRMVPRPWRRTAVEGERGRFSLSLYLRHREYNAGIGAILLYLSLLLLRPLVALAMHGAR
jgi:hypothetical protein